MERTVLVEQARQLRSKWHSGEYVSISAAISLANRLADAMEHEAPRPDHAEGQDSRAG